MELTQEQKDAITAAVTEAVKPITEQVATIVKSVEEFGEVKTQITQIVEDVSALQIGAKPENAAVSSWFIFWFSVRAS